ncbi:hypothetical protein D3C79_702990 [compost metagenome]
MQARLFQVIATGHTTDGNHATDMLDRWCQGNRNNEQDRLPVERRCREVWQGQPRGGGNLGGIDHAEVERQSKANQHASNNRNQAEDAFAEHCDDQGGQQRRHRDQHRRAVGQQLGTVTGFAHGHVGGNRRHGQADRNNHRADDYRRQQAIDKTGAFDFHRQAEERVDKTCRHHPAHGLSQAELTLGKNDRGNEGKARSQKYRDLTPGHYLKQQSSQTRSEQRDVRVKAGDQRHQHQRAKGDEEHLRAGDDLAPERVVELLLHAQASFCLVPKILSPASPRPGMM